MRGCSKNNSLKSGDKRESQGTFSAKAKLPVQAISHDILNASVKTQCAKINYAEKRLHFYKFTALGNGQADA